MGSGDLGGVSGVKSLTIQGGARGLGGWRELEKTRGQGVCETVRRGW